MKYLLLWIWQLPQHILGILMLLYWKITKSIHKVEKYKHTTVWWLYHKSFPGVSLGNYIFINKMLRYRDDDPYYDPFVVPHEYGHSIQSRMLGPLYLIVVGIPSFMQNVIAASWLKLSKNSPKAKEYALNYYNRYPENWADRLG